jgi:MFS family permease
MITLLSVLSAGFIITEISNIWNVYVAYSTLFTIAFIARLVSAFWIHKHKEIPHFFVPENSFSFKDFLSRAYESNFLKFVLFVAVYNFAISLSSPFMGMYFLTKLKLAPATFSTLVAIGLFAQFLTMRHWGLLSDELGTKKLMIVCTSGLALVPFCWLACSNIFWIAFIHFFNGIVFAGYQLSTSTFLFDAVTPQKRTRCVAYQAIINNSFVLLGTLFGGLIVALVPSSLPAFQTRFMSSDSSLLLLMLISGMLRMVFLVFLTSFKEVRSTVYLKPSEFFFRIALIRPFAGSNISIEPGSSEDN